MNNFIFQTICGAATGLCIGVTLLAVAFFVNWPRGPMDDPGCILTMGLFIVAIPFLLLTTVIGTIVGLIVEFARRIIVRHKERVKGSGVFVGQRLPTPLTPRMKTFILQAICGAAMGLCIGVTLLTMALFVTWPILTMDVLIVAPPFLLLATVIGTIVGLIGEFVRQIIVRHKQNQEEDAFFDGWIRGLKKD